jgi:hypothetical protein
MMQRLPMVRAADGKSSSRADLMKSTTARVMWGILVLVIIGLISDQ